MTRPIRVLHLEDSPHDAELIRRRLEGENVPCDILLVSSKDGFETALTRETFDLIISDFNLPGYGGLSALKHAQATQPDVPVILVSGTVVEMQAVESLHIGATDYLLKDRLERLVPAVQRALREAETRRARHRVETALGDSESRKAAILDSVLDCIVTMDAVGTVMEFNSAASRTFGYSKAEAIGRPLADLIIPSPFRERHRAGLARYLATGDGPIIGKLIEITAMRADGSEIPVELTITAIRSGQETIFTGVLRDITARKLAESTLRDERDRANLAVQALTKAEERMRFVLEAAGAGIWDLDFATGALQWSEILEAQNGLQPGTFGGTFEAFVERVHPEDRDALRETMKAQSGANFSIEHRTLWPDGTVRWLSGAGRIDAGPGGEPVRAVGISLDVTERHTLAAQYQQAQKMEAIGRLAGGVAHDFNNLLTVILGFCELLLADLKPDDSRLTEITEIQAAGARAAGLTRQLLAFSRKEIIEPKRLDLNAIVAEIRVMLGRLIGEDVAIVLKLEPAPAPVRADRGQMDQIVLNLAVNARDAMPKGGTLTIETANVELVESDARTGIALKPGPYVVLTITDTGTGMTPEVQARLFEPFFTTKEPGRGTGLGLATVHGIAMQSGGGVSIASEVGKGTSFMVYFPRADSAEPAVAAPLPVDRGHAVPHGVQTVLVVEDADGLRELTKRLLERQGYTVLLAANADEARHLFGEHPSIDVLLTDVVMPGGSGPELVEQLVEKRPALKVIYMSGYTEEAIVHHGVLDPESCSCTNHSVQKASDENSVRLSIDRFPMQKTDSDMDDRFFALSIDLLCIAHFSGSFKRLNAAWEKTLGFTRDELQSKPMFDFVHPDDRQRTLDQNLKVRSGGQALGFENRYRCKDGSYRWLVWNATADLEHEVIYSVARDITERKQAEHEREQLLGELQDALAELKDLRTILPICAYCKNVRDAANYWQTIESYISRQTNAKLSHGICPACYESVVEPLLRDPRPE